MTAKSSLHSQDKSHDYDTLSFYYIIGFNLLNFSLELLYLYLCGILPCSFPCNRFVWLGYQDNFGPRVMTASQNELETIATWIF